MAALSQVPYTFCGGLIQEITKSRIQDPRNPKSKIKNKIKTSLVEHVGSSQYVMRGCIKSPISKQPIIKFDGHCSATVWQNYSS